MKNTFVVVSSVGPGRDRSRGTREQPFWDEHAAFIDRLVADEFILMGGPLVGQDGLPQGALLIVNAQDEDEVTEKLKHDPWFERGILKLESIKRWEIFIDVRK
ncbi:MAG TPA: YciI family protein [Candidatus Udaeobacter sp.]|nr:YciI family protein [Candidatus Udaeobacter sp.]